jgi:hypothetical protein
MTTLLRRSIALLLLASPALGVDITAPGQTVPKGR